MMNPIVAMVAANRMIALGLTLLILVGLPVSGLAANTADMENQPGPDEFTPLGTAVLELLRSGNAGQFATNLTASVADQQGVQLTNLPAKDASKPRNFQSVFEYECEKNQASAAEVVKLATSLHLDFNQGEWRPRVVLPKHLGQIAWPGQQQRSWAEHVDIVLESGSGSTTNGDFKLVVRGLSKYPGGWRGGGGIQWAAFPANVGDEQLHRQLAILDKVAANQGFNGQDDPALARLGETLVHFLQEQDSTIFERDACVTPDLMWAQMERSGRKGPTRQELDTEIGKRAKDQAEQARTVLKQLEDSGVDLKHANIQIKEASVARAQGGSGSLDGLMGNQFKLTLAVTSPGKAKNGTPLTGEYILAATALQRFADDWKVMGQLRWFQLPEGVLEPEAATQLRFENYIAEHHTLPPHTPAPEIEFTTVDGEKSMKLSDFKGKVVVLDFWATWCGPCQQPMAELQQIRDKHPDWKDRVVIVPLSIDDTLEAVRKHVAKRDWTNTFNVWAGEGGWRSKPPKTFRVTGVPTTYILDAEGKIVVAGHPAAMPIEETVDRLLKPF